MTLIVWLPVPDGDFLWDNSRVMVRETMIAIETRNGRFLEIALPPGMRVCQQAALPDSYGYIYRPVEEMSVYDLVLAATHLMRDFLGNITETERQVYLARMDSLTREAKRRDEKEQENKATESEGTRKAQSD